MALNAAFLHALGDSVQSVGVVLAGVFIWVQNHRHYGTPAVRQSLYNLADPVSSLFFAVVTLYTTKSLLAQLLGILMESKPEGVDYAKLERELLRVKGVASLHDLHVWSLSGDTIALSVHLVASNQGEALAAAQRVCRKHRIEHTTIQVDGIEVGDSQCSFSGCVPMGIEACGRDCH